MTPVVLSREMNKPTPYFDAWASAQEVFSLASVAAGAAIDLLRAARGVDNPDTDSVYRCLWSALDVRRKMRSTANQVLQASLAEIDDAR